MRERALSHKPKSVLVAHLPVAAVNEQQRTGTGLALKEVVAQTLGRSKRHIQLSSRSLHQLRTAGFEISELPSTVGDGTGIVVGRITRDLREVQ